MYCTLAAELSKDWSKLMNEVVHHLMIVLKV